MRFRVGWLLRDLAVPVCLDATVLAGILAESSACVARAQAMEVADEQAASGCERFR